MVQLYPGGPPDIAIMIQGSTGQQRSGGSRSPRKVAGWHRRCLFSRSEDEFIGSGLELGENFRWPGSPKGLRVLTGSVLGYHEVSSIHAAVVTPAEWGVVGFQVEGIVDQVCKLIRGGCEVVLCPDKAISTGVVRERELLIRLFRVQGLVAGFSRGEAGQNEVMTVHLRGMELSNIWYCELRGQGETGVRGYMVSWGQIIYSYSEYRKERVQYVAVISTVCVSLWDPGEEEVNALVEEAVDALKLEQPVYSSDIVGFAESSSSSWRFRPRAKVGKVDVYYTYLEEKYRERYGLELDTMEQEAGEMGTSVFICGMPSWVYPRNGLDTGGRSPS